MTTRNFPIAADVDLVNDAVAVAAVVPPLESFAPSGGLIAKAALMGASLIQAALFAITPADKDQPLAKRLHENRRRFGSRKMSPLATLFTSLTLFVDTVSVLSPATAASPAGDKARAALLGTSLITSLYTNVFTRTYSTISPAPDAAVLQHQVTAPTEPVAARRRNSPVFERPLDTAAAAVTPPPSRGSWSLPGEAARAALLGASRTISVKTKIFLRMYSTISTVPFELFSNTLAGIVDVADNAKVVAL